MTANSARWFASIAGVLLLAGAATMVAAQYEHPQPPELTVVNHDAIPFELFRGNRIFVPAAINGHQTSVLLDTGASSTTVDRAYARSIGLPEGQKIMGHGPGGDVEAELVRDVTLEVGGLRFTKMTIAVMDLQSITRAIGRPINIVLGREFFNSSVVSIDWAEKRLRVTEHEQFKPASDAQALELTRRGPFNFIPISVAGAQPTTALLDLGSGGTLILPPTYWKGRSELTSLKSASTVVGGVGGLHSGRAAIVPQVVLAGKAFTAVPAIMSDVGNDHDAAVAANVGIGFLKQFRVDLDLGRDRIYLAPRPDAPAFERDRSGVRFDLLGDRLKAIFVSPEGPAAAAGLKAGDEIVAVDGRAITPSYYDAPDWTRAAAGKKVVLARADGSKVTIILADYY